MRMLRSVLFGMLFLSGVCLAQTKPGDVVADIPFEFVAGGQTLPAGHYIISPRTDGDLSIQAPRSQMFVPAHAGQRSPSDNSCRVVFHHYADRYFLAEVWVTGNATGRMLYPSSAERELAARGAAKETTVIAAK